MKKLGLLVKETLENRIKDSLNESESFFIINYSKLSSPDLTNLRQSLKGAKADLFVVKNSVVRRALIGAGLENLAKFVDGPCGLVFAKEEPADTSRVLCNFSKEKEQLKIKGGILNERVLEKSDIEALARLPVKAVLRAQVVTTLKSPIFGLVMVLKGNLRKFVYCLEQIKQKKSTGGSPQ